MDYNRPATYRVSAAIGATAAGPWVEAGPTAKGVRLFVVVSAKSGTSPTLDIKVQVRDPETRDAVDLDSCALAQFTDTGSKHLTIYPGIAETANVSVSDHIGQEWRLYYTVGGSATPTMTFSVGAQYLS